MNMETIVQELGPCGLDCSRCVQYQSGKVQKLSKELSLALGNFARRAEKMSAFAPVFKEYAAFEKILEFFTEASCRGCRQGDSKYPQCAAKDCIRTKQVDFCFQCAEFPCKRNSYPEELEKRWLANNQYMKDSGIEAFYHEQKKKPRYQ